MTQTPFSFHIQSTFCSPSAVLPQTITKALFHTPPGYTRTVHHHGFSHYVFKLVPHNTNSSMSVSVNNQSKRACLSSTHAAFD